MTMIDPATFKLETPTDFAGQTAELGTVEVTLRGQTKRVSAIRCTGGQIYARGLVGRYQSASKIWPAMLIFYPAKDSNAAREVALFGRDDRDPKFRKENSLWFA